MCAKRAQLRAEVVRRPWCGAAHPQINKHRTTDRRKEASPRQMHGRGRGKTAEESLLHLQRQAPGGAPQSGSRLCRRHSRYQEHSGLPLESAAPRRLQERARGGQRPARDACAQSTTEATIEGRKSLVGQIPKSFPHFARENPFRQNSKSVGNCDAALPE